MVDGLHYFKPHLPGLGLYDTMDDLEAVSWLVPVYCIALRALG